MTPDHKTYRSLDEIISDCFPNAKPCGICGAQACVAHDPWHDPELDAEQGCADA